MISVIPIFLNASIFGQNTGKISITKNFEFIGRASGTTTLANNTVYNNTFDFNVGLDLNSYGPNLFGSDGKFQSGIGSMNFTMYFEMAFTCKNSTIRQLKSSIIVKNTAGTNIDNSYTQGIHYRTAQTFNEIIYYGVVPLKHIISAGHQIILSTVYDFTTGSEGASTAMEGKFTIERNPL